MVGARQGLATLIVGVRSDDLDRMVVQVAFVTITAALA
jgi:hypothetical protein